MQEKITGTAVLGLYIHSDHTQNRPILRYISGEAAQEASQYFGNESSSRMTELKVVMAQKHSQVCWVSTSSSGRDCKCGRVVNLSRAYKNI